MRSSNDTLKALAIASVGLLGCMPTDVSGDMPPIGNDGECSTISGDFTITSAASTSALPQKCFKVTGKLEIRNTDLIDFALLSFLREAQSLVIVGNQQLQSTEGLDYVKVTQEIKIVGNPVLADIVGLEATETLGRGMTIQDNPSLSNLSGLRSLIKIGIDGFQFINNGGLPSLDQLNTFEELSRVKIEGNQGLTNLKFDVKTVTGDIDIKDNRDMTRLDSFGSLANVSGNLSIEGNTALTILSGFTSKFSVLGGNLAVIGNTALSDAYDLSISLETVGGSIVVINNLALSDCRAGEFEDVLSGSLPDIGDNGPFDPCY